MSCVIEIGLYTRNAYRWIQKSWKPIMRHASSKHLWPGSQELMNIGGVSHFNGDSEVDQVARGFLNKNTTSDDQHKIGKCTLQGNTTQEVEGLCTNQELKQELDHLGVDCKAMDALINKCAVAVTELEKYLSMKGTKPLATGDLKEAQDALAVAGISMKDVEQSNIIFRGAINIVRSDLHKDLPQVKSEGALGKIQNETQGNIYSYKAFPTIEVPLAPPAQKTDSSDAFDPDKYDVSTDTTEIEKSQEAQMQTVLDDSKSRILMRYALLKALYVLEAGGKNCKAKIVFNDPKNTES